MKFYSKTKFIISIVIGICLSVNLAFIVYESQIETANTNKAIEQVTTQVKALIDKLYEEGTVSYTESSKIGYSEGADYSYLSGHNLSIAKAKFDVNTKAHHDDPDTIKKSKKVYRTKSEVQTTAILVGFFSPILTIPFCLLVPFIVSVIWYFVLDRINEMSNAIQGKR